MAVHGHVSIVCWGKTIWRGGADDEEARGLGSLDEGRLVEASRLFVYAESKLTE